MALMEKSIVAAFDFDGTITYGDTLLSFLLFAKPLKAPFLLAKIAPHLFLYTLGRLSRKEAKQLCLKAFFSGMSYQEFQEIARRFSLEKIDKKVRPESLERIKWHKKSGHRLVLVSASIETYLIPWAEKMGFEKVLASKLEIIDGKVTGNLLGKNCREKEKVFRLQEYLGPKDRYTLFAYGNSDGDHAMLAFADYSYYNKMSDD
jgi:HAD superfamily hydrolase (TIGR01490 family)